MMKHIIGLLNQWSDWDSYPYAGSIPTASGQFKLTPEDFVVKEVLGFPLSESGEHVWLKIKKREANTIFVAKQIARFANVPVRDIGYAGLKDRQAVTIQYFSVPNKATIDWSQLQHPEFKIIEIKLHSKKLKRGVHAGNMFRITLRDIEGELAQLKKAWERISTVGIPNYIGPQRFGHNKSNIKQVGRLFDGENLKAFDRSLALSALRSAVFNAVLAHRVREKTWNTAVLGDAMQLDGSQSYFTSKKVDEELLERVRMMDVHPTGPLVGTGKSGVDHKAAVLESNYTRDLLSWEGLKKFKLEFARRPLRVVPQNSKIEILDSETARVEFYLPKGCYATAVLRELIQVKINENIIKQ